MRTPEETLAQLDGIETWTAREDVPDLVALVRHLVAERDAYKRAKAENDERFMLERDEARGERESCAPSTQTRETWMKSCACVLRALGCDPGFYDGYLCACENQEHAEEGGFLLPYGEDAPRAGHARGR